MSESPIIFDRALVRRRRERALRLGPTTFLLDRVADDMAERLAAVTRRFDLALDLGTPTQALRLALARLPSIGTIVGTEPIASEAARQNAVAADEEALPFRDVSLDLVVSGLALQFVNDLPGVLIQIRRALKPDGLFVGALLGGETLTELRQSFAGAESEIEGGISPRVAPFADVRDLGGLLQRAGFALPVADIDRTTIRYRDPMRLFLDLRALGETNVLAQRRPNFTSRRLIHAVLGEYLENFGDDQNRVPATFDIVYLTGWAPHESQQKPLRPGSAKARLS